MRSPKRNWREVLLSFKRIIIRERIEAPPDVMALLRALYPCIDWGKVDFYRGLPWFIQVFSPFTTATTLPATLSFSRIQIYFREFDPTRRTNLSTIVHEAFHVMQYQQNLKGLGPGFLKLFIIYYIANSLKEGYRLNFFEDTAYKYEHHFLVCFDKTGRRICKPQDAKTSEESLKNLVECDPSLVNEFFHTYYSNGIMRLTAGIIIALLITILKPLVESILFLTGMPALGIVTLFDRYSAQAPG